MLIFKNFQYPISRNLSISGHFIEIYFLKRPKELLTKVTDRIKKTPSITEYISNL